MKKIIFFILLFALLSFHSCRQQESPASTDYVRAENGVFKIGDSTYRYVGTNFWYGAILASQGQGGDRDRLARELDLMQEYGIDNLRIMVGGDGNENIASHILPNLQLEPGVYNDTILDGLDYLLAELEKRGMKAVLYLNNAWEWSGGYGTYLKWAGAGNPPDPNFDSYGEYVDFVAQFVHNDSAKQMSADHVKNIVSRVNRYTNKPYAESPAIMSWQIANEPRPFAPDSVTKELFAQWIGSQAALIKSLDSNHMVSTGSEGKFGCEYDIDLWARIHSDPNIDYGLIHLWPYNWGWVNRSNPGENLDSVFAYSHDYVLPHRVLMNEIGKPLVLEEFGYPRDSVSFALDSSTDARDKFYEYVFSMINDENLFDGCNFWGWAGYGIPTAERWQPWSDYTADPAQEPQGLYSIFASDSTTMAIIKRASDRVK